MYKTYFMLGCSKLEAQKPISSLVEAEKKKSLVASSLQQALLSLHWCTLADAQLRAKRSVSGPAIPSANQGLHRRAGSCWWVGQSTAMKHGQLPVLLQMDDYYSVQVEHGAVY